MTEKILDRKMIWLELSGGKVLDVHHLVVNDGICHKVFIFHVHSTITVFESFQWAAKPTE